MHSGTKVTFSFPSSPSSLCSLKQELPAIKLTISAAPHSTSADTRMLCVVPSASKTKKTGLSCSSSSALRSTLFTHSLISHSWHQRTFSGSSIGSLETWLLLRSLRTLSLRVVRQAETATALAQWLDSLSRASPGSDVDGPAGVIEKVWHTALQEEKGLYGEGKQVEKGPACFAILLAKAEYAKHLPHSLSFFVVRLPLTLLSPFRGGIY